MTSSGSSLAIRKDELARLVRETMRRREVFTGVSKSYCIGLVDVVNSTANTARIPSSKIGEYYGTFLKAMSTIVQEFGAKVIKNIGDSILYYFPKTSFDTGSFLDVLECSLAILDSHGIVNEIMEEKTLPRTDFRISADYGMVAKTISAEEDMFGPTVNLCSKINGAASTNGFVIGGDLYQVVRSMKGYEFFTIGSYGLGLKFNYPVYGVKRKIS